MPTCSNNSGGSDTCRNGSLVTGIDTFWIGRNPASRRLPYLLRLPVTGAGRVFLAAGDTWPHGKDVFCVQLDSWPGDGEIIEQVPVEACWWKGAAVHLVLARKQARRSMFVWTMSRGRPVIFWRSQTSMRGSRPGIRVPQARALRETLEIAIDSGERYPWGFARQSARTTRRSLPSGDYAVLRGDEIVAVVERKSVGDLATSAVAGQLSLTLADLERAPHASLVVEGRLSDVVKTGARGDVRPGWLLDIIAALQVAHPRVMWTFAETRAIAEDWAHRWLAACVKSEQPRYEIPLLDERAFGDPVAATARRSAPRVLDAVARRALALREAEAGTVWTSSALAARTGVSQAVAGQDLNALVAEGRLVREGGGRARRYRSPVTG